MALFENLRGFGAIWNLEVITNGLRITTEKQLVFIITEKHINQCRHWYEVCLPLNSYKSRYVYTMANSEQDALDFAVNFLMENEIPFNHYDFYEAYDNNLVTDSGEVMDSICCGDSCVYIPCYSTVHMCGV